MILRQAQDRSVQLRSSGAGFTFVELLVVITIIGIIFASAAAAFTVITVRSRDARRGSDLEVIRQALEMCRSIDGVYPSTIYDNGTGGVVCSVSGTVTLAETPTDPRESDVCALNYAYSNPNNDGYASYLLTACQEIAEPDDPIGQQVTSP